MSGELNPARLLLSKIRGGDFAHAGDRDAIEMVLDKVGAVEGSILDVGSGLGGTADYFQKKGFSPVFGLDMDGAAVEYAQKRYPDVTFVEGDARHFSFDQQFSLLTLFNVLYAIEEQDLVIQQLAHVAKPGAWLAIFDYTLNDTNFECDLKDLAGKKMFPLNLAKTTSILQHEGWEVVEIVDLTADYVRWYKDLLTKLEGKTIYATFDHLLKLLENGSLGGAIIYARFFK